MRITIPTLAAAISLTVFACSESPSSTTDDSSSSEAVLSSSSDEPGGSSSSGITGSACQYSGEEFGISGLFICADVPSDAPNWLAQKIECDEDGGTWIDACPSGEKAICIDEEDENAKDVLYKLYADGFTCGDFSLKNADGSTDIISKGGACGPFMPAENVPFSMCAEFPELPTSIIKLSCTELEAPFANECPGNADLICYDPEEEMISHLYGEAVLDLTCKDLDMEELQEAFSTFP